MKTIEQLRKRKNIIKNIALTLTLIALLAEVLLGGKL